MLEAINNWAINTLSTTMSLIVMVSILSIMS